MTAQTVKDYLKSVLQANSVAKPSNAYVGRVVF